MAKTNALQKFTDSAAEFLATLVKKVKKMDRRMLIMIGAAAVLVIVIFALIIHGVSSSKNNDDVIESPSGSVQNIQELPSEDFVNKDESGNPGVYKVDTGSDADLNMRLAADRDSDIVTKIPAGTELEVMFIDDSDVESAGDFGWGYVEYNGERGWVFMEYLIKK